MNPRILISATSSGSGKTTIVCGILQALVNRGMKVSSFKCGPDYIDPMFHSRVIGTKSRNLDPFFTDENLLKYLFSKSADGSDISIIEGVMGFYDGSEITTTKASSHDVSMKLGAPAVLIVNSKGASISTLAVIKGFMGFEKNNIKGVIFNQMSENIFRQLKPEAEKLGVKVIGYVPKLKDIVLESRHLGLMLPSEIENLKDMLNRLAEIIEESLDLGLLIELASDIPDLEYDIPKIEKQKPVRIGLADDDAFCFIYEDNISLLEECGAEIIRFSPINDNSLPDIDGIILPGGYPELFCEKLESNISMRNDIRLKISEGLPCLAECGGFMYLHDKMKDHNGRTFDMCGVIEGSTENKEKLTRFGYITLKNNTDGTVVKGHEFHYWDSTNCGSDWTAEKKNKQYGCIHDDGRLTVGYPHIYYYSNPEFVYRFMKRVLKYSESKTE